jgi:hypothetical protein
VQQAALIRPLGFFEVRLRLRLRLCHHRNLRWS